MMNGKRIAQLIIAGIFFVFLGISFPLNIELGREIAMNIRSFLRQIILILPCVFILIGLFEVWVKRDAVEKHLGTEAGIKGYLWPILFAATTVGGLFVAFPIGHSLYKKGARPSVVFTYLGASTVCRVPMTLFEVSFLGWKFTLIRMVAALPLIVLTSILIEKILKGKLDISRGDS